MPSDVSTAGVEGNLRRKVQELEQKLAEAHQREAATSEVLSVIGTSPNDVQSVYQAIAERACQLCKAKIGATIAWMATLCTSPARAFLGGSDDDPSEMIKECVHSGMDRMRNAIERNRYYATKKGTTIKKIGRPGAEPAKLEQAKKLLNEGWGIRKVGRELGLGTGTFMQLKKEMSTIAAKS
jgi:hypothetical protein